MEQVVGNLKDKTGSFILAYDLNTDVLVLRSMGKTLEEVQSDGVSTDLALLEKFENAPSAYSVEVANFLKASKDEEVSGDKAVSALRGLFSQSYTSGYGVDLMALGRVLEERVERAKLRPIFGGVIKVGNTSGVSLGVDYGGAVR